jgi:MFS superfamily sulfate permease-like transporter
MANHKVMGARFFKSWKDDLLASVVVSLVALPLCMGIAIASGLPPAPGILTGIIGGLVVGSLSGSPLQVSGPAAGLSVIVWEAVREHGVAALGVIVLLAGAFQVAAGLLRLGQWFRAVSPAVITGMLAGIGVLIFASQFHVMVDDGPQGSGLDNLRSIPAAVWKGLAPPDGSAHHLAAYLGVLTIAAIVLWKPLAPRRLQVLPAPLVAVALATAVAAWFDLPERGVRCVELPATLLAAVRWPTWDTVSHSLSWPVLVAGLSMAVVASAETLLSAAAVDRMHQGPRTRYDRELAAQGVGNLLCGLLGALPMTGVIVRSATNVQAGARTRASAVLHGLWLLAFVSLLPFVLEWIPTASLAAVLVFTGCKLVNPQAVRTLWAYGKGEVVIYAATVLTIVGANLLTGILVGCGLSLVKLLYTFSHLTMRLEGDAPHGRTVLFLEGAATFLRLPRLAAVLETVPPGTELHVHFEGLRYIDHACLDLLMTWGKRHEATGGSLVLDWESLTARFHPQGGGNGQRTGSPTPAEVGTNGVPDGSTRRSKGRGAGPP